MTVYKLLTGSVVPRPIAWVSTIAKDGILNCAPFSFFNAFCGEPPIVGFCPSVRVPPLDTLVNCRDTGEFVVNIVTEENMDAMNATSGQYPAHVDEFQVAGLTPAPSKLVKAPRVAESPINFECKVIQIIELSKKEIGGSLVLGEVVQMHFAEGLVNDRYYIDQEKLHAVGRMGGTAYTRTRDKFDMTRPR